MPVTRSVRTPTLVAALRDLTRDGQPVERPADPAAPFAALAFKVQVTATGRLTYLRVYSGTLHKGDVVLDAGAGRTERIGRILRVQADRHTEVDRAATHPKDSSELAFRNAGRLGLRAALRACVMTLLEPVVEVTVTAPDDAVGAVLGDLAARRGRVTGSVSRAGTVVVTATVPLAELFGYASRLRGRTQRRGTLTTRPIGYAPVPGTVAGGTPVSR